MDQTRGIILFNDEQLAVVDQAVSISEEVVSDRFNLGISNWKTYRYEILTQKDLEEPARDDGAFAQILRAARPGSLDGMRTNDLYRICLRDHNIMRALRREGTISLLALLIYIVTHELTHVVRFYKFLQNFEADEKQRLAEEALVHQLTYEMLRSIRLPNLALILDFYAKHRERFY